LEKRERVILYSDLNNFFASVETVLNPEFKGKPLIVCGDPKERRGVVFAKNEEAKKYGIKTAETVVSALKKCPHVLRVQTHFHEYKKYSRKVREIYERFTDIIEERSIDECALDVTGSVALFGRGEEIAHKIRETVKKELGLTVSVGVSFNKVFAKIASDMKKPDAVTVISRANFKEKLYPLPVSDMLLVGKSTAEIFQKMGIFTIGDLANADEAILTQKMGKRGRQVWIYARGEDTEPVKGKEELSDLKSIGNSTTLPYDIKNREEIKRWLFVLAESVTARQRDAGVGRATTVHIAVKNERLEDFSWQRKVSPTSLCSDVAKTAFELFCQHYPQGAPVHLLGISVSGFDYNVAQITLSDAFGGAEDYKKKERIETAVDKIRRKYGYATVQRAIVLEDEKLNGLDIRGKKYEAEPKKDKKENTYGQTNDGMERL